LEFFILFLISSSFVFIASKYAIDRIGGISELSTTPSFSARFNSPQFAITTFLKGAASFGEVYILILY